MATLGYLGFVALLACLRLWELRASKRNLARHRPGTRTLREPLFPWMVLLHTSFFILIPFELWWRAPGIGGPLTWIALAFTAAALALRVWTLRTLGKSWNVRVVHGPEYPISCSGPYRYIRHPNYVVVFLELMFVPLIHHLVWSAALLSSANLPVLFLRIRKEERILARNPQWLATMADKPRFLPRFWRTAPSPASK